MSAQCTDIAESIDCLQSEFEKDDNCYTGPINAYHNAMFEFWSWFGDGNVPFLEDVRDEWLDQINKLRVQTMQDADVKNIFTDIEKFKEVAHLRDQLNNMVDCFREFRESYEQKSFWERCFVSWKDEQKILNEKVRFSSLPN